MEILHEEHDMLWTMRIEEDAPHVADDAKKLKTLRKSRSILRQRIVDSNLEYVNSKESPFKIWKGLIETFVRKMIKSQLFTIRRLLSLNFEEKQKLASYFLTFDKFIRDLGKST
ncbi:Hypothetical protein CINCED_3A006778 [Cinara cedri]|uniref:Uncharacterized protein n=1 Tax=Cinara cedri TaxID=506608 RepID=A0A5E4NCC0_9HEMI|nr:Hypothetical protein CINCED_3A006778 [Cinara cedri]